MASIPVMNPPHRSRRRKSVQKRRVRRKRHTRKHKISAASLAALQRINDSRKRRRHKKRRARKEHGKKRRKFLGHKKAKHVRRHKRPTFNPFAGELMMMGNPHRKRRHTMARHHRRHRRKHYLSNPFSASALLSKPKEMFSKDFAMDAVSATAGFFLPGVVLNYLPTTFRDTKVKYYASKVASVAILSAAAGMVSKKASRMVLLGGGVSLLADLYTEFRARTETPAPAAGTKHYYGGMQGDEGMGMYYGPGIGDDIVLSDTGDETSY